MTTKLQAIVVAATAIGDIATYIARPELGSQQKLNDLRSELESSYGLLTSAQELGNPSDYKEDLKHVKSNLDNARDYLKLIYGNTGFDKLVGQVGDIYDSIAGGAPLPSLRISANRSPMAA